jgi:anti-anti-sigma regulatory factor
MTYEFASEIEEVMLDAMRHYAHVEVDLSKVHEIDICGVHLLGFLENFSGKGLHIVARSPAVEQAYERLHSRSAGESSREKPLKQPKCAA